jgi:hypothetical protein
MEGEGVPMARSADGMVPRNGAMQLDRGEEAEKKN